MRLFFVSHSFPPADRPLASVGGMQRVAVELDAALRKRRDVDYESLILRSSWRGVQRRTLLFVARTYFRLLARIRGGDVDVVLFSSMVTANLSVLLRRQMNRRGVRAAAIVHGQDVTMPYRLYQRWVPRVFEALDLVMPVSRATGEACLERGLERDKLRVVNNGVDVERFDSAETDATRERARRLRTEFGGGRDSDAAPLLLLSVGRQVRRKGFKWFIRNVVPSLPEHVGYWLAGDGPESDAIESAIRDVCPDGRVRRLGRVDDDDLIALYAAADLFIMPNIHVPGDMEGFGIVMLEAGMMGLPTIAARLEGIREVVTEGENGHFVESGDADGFAGRILQLDGDRAALEALSTRTRRHVRQTFGWPTIVSNYVDALRKLTG